MHIRVWQSHSNRFIQFIKIITISALMHKWGTRGTSEQQPQISHVLKVRTNYRSSRPHRDSQSRHKTSTSILTSNGSIIGQFSRRSRQFAIASSRTPSPKSVGAAAETSTGEYKHQMSVRSRTAIACDHIEATLWKKNLHI